MVGWIQVCTLKTKPKTQAKSLRRDEKEWAAQHAGSPATSLHCLWHRGLPAQLTEREHVVRGEASALLYTCTSIHVRLRGAAHREKCWCCGVI